MLSQKKNVNIYALISIEPKALMEYVEKMLKQIKEVEEIVEVLGPYEILVKFAFKGDTNPSHVLEKIETIRGVKECLTLIVTKEIFNKSKQRNHGY